MAYLLYNAAATRLAQDLARFINTDGFDSISFFMSQAVRCDTSLLYYVVPTRRRARWLQREFTRRVFSEHHSGGIHTRIRIINLADLSHILYRQLNNGQEPLLLSEALQLALFEHIIESLATERRLPFYARNGKPAWNIIERIVAVITGLREDGITPNELISNLETQDDLHVTDLPRLQDIVTVYQRYITHLGNPYLDQTSVYNAIANTLNASLPQIEGILSIVLEGFTAFRIPEVNMLGSLAHSSIPVCLVLMYSPVNGPLFGNLEATLTALQKVGYTSHSCGSLRDDNESLICYPRAAYLRRWLFNTEQDIRNSNFTNAITILGCTNAVEEVTLITKYVKYCLKELGYKPHQICIAMRQPELYTDLFRELFAAHGIPANITDRFQLDRSPVAAAVMSVLEVIVNGWRREDLHRMLSNPLLVCTDENGNRLDAALINDVAERQRISGGHVAGGSQSWLSRLEQSKQAAIHYHERLATDPYADELDIRRAKQDVEAIEHVLRDVTALHNLLPQPSQRLTISQFCNFVRETILDKLNLASSVERACEEAWKLDKRTPTDIMFSELLEQHTRAYAALLVVLSQMEYAWTQIHPSLSERNFAEHCELFATMIRASRYQIAEKPGYGVTVTSIEQTRGIPYDIYILCGMIDGVFPKTYSIEHFLGIELPDSKDRHIRSERIQFYETLTNNPRALEANTWHMLITYPRFSSNGEPLVCSSFIEKLLKITTLSENVFPIHTLRQCMQSEPNLRQRFCWIETLTSYDELYIHNREPDLWQPPSVVHLTDYARNQIASLLQRPFSAEELEQYAACPYQYFTERILNLRKPERYDLPLSALETGRLVHRILHRFYTSIIEQEGTLDPESGIRTVRLKPSHHDKYASLLHEIARDELQSYQYSHPLFVLECEQLLGNEEKEGLLVQWLERELKRFDSEWEYAPTLFEVGFGMSSRTASTVEAPVRLSNDLTIRGKIDRLEVRQIGGQLHVLIADYKLRRKGGSINDIRKGRSFQIPFYMHAAREIVRRHWNIEPILDGGIYYMLQGSEDAIAVLMPQEACTFAFERKGNRSEIVPDRTTQDELLHNAITYAEQIVGTISHGVFRIRPITHDTCKHCPFSSICRIRQLRDEGLIKPQ